MKQFLSLICLSLLFVQCKKTNESNYNYNIAIFGGSQSVSNNSHPIKEKWSKMFNANVNSCGVVGAGYGMWQENNVKKQIDAAPISDVYILWSSTNDSGTNIALDSDDNPKSQSGGLKICIDRIKEINPKAIILLFTSFPVPHEKIVTVLPLLVEKQIEFCKRYNIPYLNQFENPVLTESDFLDDKIHLKSIDGYWKLEPRQTEFLNKYVK